MNLMVIMGLRVRALKILLWLNTYLLKCVKKKKFLDKLKIFKKLVSELGKEGDVLPKKVCGSFPCL